MLFDVQEEMEERFGDIRRHAEPYGYRAGQGAVRSRAVLTLTVREGTARMAFHQQAQLDGARMLQAASTFGAQILPGETVSLLYKKPGADVEEMLRALPPLLEALGGCV
jgi:hypothetical protein